MKTTIRSVAFLGVMLCSAYAIPAQTTSSTTTTTTTSDGTITQMTQDGMVIKSATSVEPINYSSTKTTTYVDENGNPVSVETIKSGLPVTVYYDKNGDKMVATKVVVKKTTILDPATPATATSLATSTTTTTTSEGTVSELSRDGIVIKSTTSTDPISYSSTKTTTYVDEDGKPVAIRTVKSGQPVTIYYDKNGDKLVATKVVVKKTTTTTTTTPTP